MRVLYDRMDAVIREISPPDPTSADVVVITPPSKKIRGASSPPSDRGASTPSTGSGWSRAPSVAFA
eukprot:10380965-Lingulodinium_polyedra.AAC.1